jgi:HSP20 family protein
MSLVRWDPLLEMAEVGERVRALLGAGFPAGGAAEPVPVDVYETTEEFVVHAALPAVKREDVQVEMGTDRLVIRANRLASAPEGATPLLRELPNGEFTRVIGFSVPVDRDGVSASLADGRLTVRVPKAAAARPRMVEIKPEA